MLHFFSSLRRFSLFMASKPQRIDQIAGTNIQSSRKRVRTMATATATSIDPSMKDAFTRYAEYLNDLCIDANTSNALMFGQRSLVDKRWKNEKRERIVKASRDVTMNSKKVIFQVHRMSKYNKVEVIEKAEKDLGAVTDQYMSQLVKELQGTDFWKLRRAYSPGIQEYVEAATFCGFCKNGTLLKLDEINKTLLRLSDPSIEPLQINVLDYLLGVADLTGELMRLAIGRISDGELEFAEKICTFSRDIYRELTLVVPHMDDSSDMKTKMDVMLQSVMKIENACFSVHVRGSEYIPLLGSNDPSSFLVGVPDIEI